MKNTFSRGRGIFSHRRGCFSQLAQHGVHQPVNSNWGKALTTLTAFKNMQLWLTAGSMDTSTSEGMSLRSASSRFCLGAGGGGVEGCWGRITHGIALQGRKTSGTPRGL